MPFDKALGHRHELRKATQRIVDAGDLTVENDGLPVTDVEKLSDVLTDAVDKQLMQLAANALLVG